MSASRGNVRRKRVEKEAEEVPAPDDQEELPTTSKRGRRPLIPSDDGGSEETPKGKRSKMEERLEVAPQARSPRRKLKSVSEAELFHTPDYSEKETGGRSRQISTTEHSDQGESVAPRSGRQRQPTRRMVESRETEEYIREQLAPKRLKVKQVDAEEVEPEHVMMESVKLETAHIEPDIEEQKVKRPAKKRVGRSEEPQQQEPQPVPGVVEHPRVVFKTVTQQPELPKEALMVPGKKPFVPGSVPPSMLTKPILPMRAGPSKPIAPVIIPRTAGTMRYVEKTPQMAPSRMVPGPSTSGERPMKTLTTAIRHPRTETAKTVVDESEAGVAYHDLSEVANEEIVDEQEFSLEPRSRRPTLSTQQRMTERMVKHEQPVAEEDDDAPPQLHAERPTHDEFSRPQMYIESENIVRFQTTGGESQYVTIARGEDGTEVYLDENGEEVEMVDEIQEDNRTVEFNFLDSKNICCGLCGEIVPYDHLMTTHLPQHHPEIMGEDGPGMNLQEVNYGEWLKDKLYMDKKNIEGGFRYDSSMGGEDFLAMRMRGSRPLRKVSQIRVNPIEMDMDQLNHALNKKMIEKMGRKVPVSLVDKQHAKCGICNAVVSLNKKFEIVHLVRHFNAWHPSAHRCSGHWQNRPSQPGCGKPLSIQDFAVIDVSMDVPDNLQCIWCGMFMDRNALAMHFTEVHPEEIEVPKCLLCLQELVINARLLEKYGEDYEVSLPDEHHFKCPKFPSTFRSEAALDKAIAKRVQKINAVANNESAPAEEDDDDGEDGDKQGTVTNSRMTFGRRNKPKRSFVQPSLRQAVPVNSKYVESVTECQWRCKLCKGNIFGAVISAGAIKHYKQYHPGEMENMQYELCKARLDRVSGGCMEFVHPQLVECLICNLTYTLHKPYNMCRGIRHLKLKHPDMMPEHSGATPKETASAQKSADNVRLGEIIEDEEMIARFRSEYHVDFDRVQAVYTSGEKEPVYVLLKEDETLDRHTANQMVQSLGEGSSDPAVKRVVIGLGVSKTATDYDEEDTFGEMPEDEEMAPVVKAEPNILGHVMAEEPAPAVAEDVVEEEGREVYQDEVVVEEEYEEYYNADEFIDAEGQFMAEEFIEGEEQEEYHDEHPEQ